MSGLFSGLFGSDDKQTVTSIPIAGSAVQLSPLYNFYGSNSSTGAAISGNGSSGNFSVGYGNPTYAGLSRFDGQNQNQMQRIGNLISGLQSNNNPFIQARVNPMKDATANARADLSRSITQRGVVGSLGNNELIKFDNNANRQIGDAASLATQESLQSIFSAEGLANNLNEGQMKLANDYLQRDLAALGLNLQAAQLALSGRQFSTPGNTQTTKAETNPGIGQILLAGGQIASGFA